MILIFWEVVVLMRPNFAQVLQLWLWVGKKTDARIQVGFSHLFCTLGLRSLDEAVDVMAQMTPSSWAILPSFLLCPSSTTDGQPYQEEVSKIGFIYLHCSLNWRVDKLSKCVNVPYLKASTCGVMVTHSKNVNIIESRYDHRLNSDQYALLLFI